MSVGCWGGEGGVGGGKQAAYLRDEHGAGNNNCSAGQANQNQSLVLWVENEIYKFFEQPLHLLCRAELCLESFKSGIGFLLFVVDQVGKFLAAVLKNEAVVAVVLGKFVFRAFA